MLVVVTPIVTPAIVLPQHTWTSGTPAVSPYCTVMSVVVTSIATTAIVLRQHTWPNGAQILSPAALLFYLLL